MRSLDDGIDIDFDGIDEMTQRHLAGIAAHNDVVLFLVYDPISERIEPGERAVIGDSRMQAEVDLGSASIRVMRIRWCAERWCCPTAPGSR